MSEFFRMGGDGAYVWSAYGVTLAVLLLNVWWARRRHRSALQRARALSGDERTGKRPTVRQIE
jgi:heme exporter protein CcmD